MNNWNFNKIGELVNINERSIDRKFLLEEIEYIDTSSTLDGNVLQTQLLKLSEAPSRAKRIVSDQSILYSTVRPNLRHFAFIEKSKPNLIASTGYAVIDCFQDKISPRFLCAFLGSEPIVNYLCGIAEGQASTFPAFNPEVIESIKIPLPPLPIQSRIAEILGRYDALIDNYQQQISALENMAQEIYKEWFVRGRCPYAEPGEEGGLPLGWEELCLGNILELKYGKSLVEEFRNEGKFPVVGSSGIVDFHDEALVKRPGIVVGRKGNVGSVFWIDKPFYPIDTAYYVESEVSYYFLFFNLQTQNFISGDAAVPGLNREQALSNKVILPSTNVLENFDNIIKRVFDKMTNLQTQLTALRQTRDALLPRLLSGQLSVVEEINPT